MLGMLHRLGISSARRGVRIPAISVRGFRAIDSHVGKTGGLGVA